MAGQSDAVLCVPIFSYNSHQQNKAFRLTDSDKAHQDLRATHKAAYQRVLKSFHYDLLIDSKA